MILLPCRYAWLNAKHLPANFSGLLHLLSGCRVQLNSFQNVSRFGWIDERGNPKREQREELGSVELWLQAENREPLPSSCHFCQSLGGWVRGPTSAALYFNTGTLTGGSPRTTGSFLKISGPQPQFPMRIIWNIVKIPVPKPQSEKWKC